MENLSDVTANEVVKNIKFNTLKTKVNSFEKKIPDPTTLIHINQYNTNKLNLKKKIGYVHKKIPDTSGLVTTKISEVENKIPNTGGLVTTTFWTNKLRKLRIKFLIPTNILLILNLMS